MVKVSKFKFGTLQAKRGLELLLKRITEERMELYWRMIVPERKASKTSPIGSSKLRNTQLLVLRKY